MVIKNQKAQAFLITSVILIMILVAFVTIANYSRKTTFSTFSYIAEEIQIESEKVMDYALLNDEPDVIDDFTKNVSDYLDEDIKIYFITNTSGNNNELEFYYYNETGDEVNLPEDLFVVGNITVTIDETNYTFPLTKGKHFYFIMIKEFKGEKYVYTNA